MEFAGKIGSLVLGQNPWAVTPKGSQAKPQSTPVMVTRRFVACSPWDVPCLRKHMRPSVTKPKSTPMIGIKRFIGACSPWDMTCLQKLMKPAMMKLKEMQPIRLERIRYCQPWDIPCLKK